MGLHAACCMASHWHLARGKDCSPAVSAALLVTVLERAVTVCRSLMSFTFYSLNDQEKHSSEQDQHSA